MDKRLRGWATFPGPPLHSAQHMSDRQYFFYATVLWGPYGGIINRVIFVSFSIGSFGSQKTHFWSNMSNTRKSVSSGYPNTERWVEKTRCSRVFLTDFEVFGYLMKHSFDFLIWLLKLFIIPGEIQSKSSENFMLIEVRYPNHRHGSDFLCFLFMH